MARCTQEDGVKNMKTIEMISGGAGFPRRGVPNPIAYMYLKIKWNDQNASVKNATALAIHSLW
jgi:hypothetical protein